MYSRTASSKVNFAPPVIDLLPPPNEKFYREIRSFFFNDTSTTEIYTTANTLSLHVALPISESAPSGWLSVSGGSGDPPDCRRPARRRSHQTNRQPLFDQGSGLDLVIDG